MRRRDWYAEYCDLKDAIEAASRYGSQRVTTRFDVEEGIGISHTIHTIEFHHEQYVLLYTHTFSYASRPDLQIFVRVPAPRTWLDWLLRRQRENHVLIWQEGAWQVHGEYEATLIRTLTTELRKAQEEAAEAIRQCGEDARRREQEQREAHDQQYRDVVARALQKGENQS